MNFAKFLRKPFLQNTSGRLRLLRLKCKVKSWLQSRRIYTPLPWPLRRLSYKPPHLKQHHCNNSWEFKILQQMSCEYLLLTSAYQNTKWHICKSIYMELIVSVHAPLSRKKNSYKRYNESRENVLFSKTRKKLINGVFLKLCLDYLYLDILHFAHVKWINFGFIKFCCVWR